MVLMFRVPPAILRSIPRGTGRYPPIWGNTALVKRTITSLLCANECAVVFPPPPPFTNEQIIVSRPGNPTCRAQRGVPVRRGCVSMMWCGLPELIPGVRKQSSYRLTHANTHANTRALAHAHTHTLAYTPERVSTHLSSPSAHTAKTNTTPTHTMA